MAEVTSAMVKDLREKTGAGMMDCKKALLESGGDVEKAITWLREKGLATAGKKARIATPRPSVADGAMAAAAELAEVAASIAAR